MAFLTGSCLGKPKDRSAKPIILWLEATGFAGARPILHVRA
jgi:hypothetical protein